jgi:hypothetical protein
VQTEKIVLVKRPLDLAKRRQQCLPLGGRLTGRERRIEAALAARTHATIIN